jgi:hypothetical protein
VSLFDTVPGEILVGFVDVHVSLAPLLEPSLWPYPFAVDPLAYNALRIDRKTPLPANVGRLGMSNQDESQFWRPYCRIGPDTLSPWQRQEPFRLTVGPRVRCSLAMPNLRLVWSAPEVLLFPAGWSTTVWLRIIGALPMSELPEILWSLDEQPVLAIHPDGLAAGTLNAALNELGRRIGRILQGRSGSPKRILRQRIVSPIAPDGAERSAEDYATEDLRVIYASLTQARAEMAPVAVMQQHCLPVEQFGGLVTIRYGRGLFLDLIGNYPRRIRCFSRNLRNMLVMTAALQATVKFGLPELPTGTPAGSLPDARRQRLTRLRQLIAGSQETLRRLPKAWPPRVCRYYCGNHEDIKEALAETIPELEP